LEQNQRILFGTGGSLSSARTFDSLAELRTVKLFRNLSSEELRAVVASTGRKTIKKGEVLFAEGEPSDRLYLVVKGKVEEARAHHLAREADHHPESPRA